MSVPRLIRCADCWRLAGMPESPRCTWGLIRPEDPDEEHECFDYRPLREADAPDKETR